MFPLKLNLDTDHAANKPKKVFMPTAVIVVIIVSLKAFIVYLSKTASLYEFIPFFNAYEITTIIGITSIIPINNILKPIKIFLVKLLLFLDFFMVFLLTVSSIFL